MNVAKPENAAGKVPDGHLSPVEPAASSQAELPGEGRRRVVIQNIWPQIDNNRFPVKRVPGELVRVRAEVFCDGHARLSVLIKFRHAEEPAWSEAPMHDVGNDQWEGTFSVTRVGIYYFAIEAWINRFRTWQEDLAKRVASGMVLELDLAAGQECIRGAREKATREDRVELERTETVLAADHPLPVQSKAALALAPQVADLVDRYVEKPFITRSENLVSVRVDPALAGFSAWYELFPRSCSPVPGQHGTLRDCARWLPRIAQMGFDVVYLPPIHPIGRQFRKGKNGTTNATAEDPGSPWAIGSPEGGHKSIHPELGNFADFDALVKTARDLRLELALDIALQCSPDHPYVREHPDWFRHRPDGSIQYAENPPKKYQDIYPLDFETADWRALWLEMRSIFEFWSEKGIRVFRVDNPHTKPFRFWEWCLGSLKAGRPELIFLSEAFTRPKVMYYLAKLGFSQSYNYFPWRNTKQELTAYFEQLTRPELLEYFRPNLWPNTPDILPEYLQHGGQAAFAIRLVLAATLGASYGVYGPPYEALAAQAREPGSEEYLDSEKYALRSWSTAPVAMSNLMTRLNRIRRDNAALHRNDTLRFHTVDNPQILAYSKQDPDLENVVVTVVNLDPRHVQRGWLELNPNLGKFGVEGRHGYQVHELLTDARYLWAGRANYVELDPAFVPAHIFRLRRHVRTEHDFDYFL